MAKKKNNPTTIRSSAAEYLSYVAATGDNPQSFEMRYEDENIWLTQKMLATLYDVSVPAINQHIKKIFDDNELESGSVIKKYLITAADGKQYNTIHYNLQMIIAVGFKVNNERAVQFRKWANQIVKDYTIKGFAMDDERLKNGGSILTEQYFEEQLQRIREIRLSERKFYQKITDIYVTAIDYDVNASATKRFCHRPKQASLGNSWTDCFRSYLYPRRRRKGTYGADHLERCASRENTEIRRVGSKKLPE